MHTFAWACPTIWKTGHLRSHKEVMLRRPKGTLLGNPPVSTCLLAQFLFLFPWCASGNANTSSRETGFHLKLHIFLVYSVHCGIEGT